MMISAREIVLALSIRCDGEWKSVYDIILKKKRLTDEEAKEAILKEKAPYKAIVDKDYPDFFKNVYQPPFLFYYYGNYDLLTARRKLTVVGTRNPTDYQRRTVPFLLEEAFSKSKVPITIVSGMAVGIDAMSMRMAMRHNLGVIAVLGSGIDHVYPEESKDIYDYCKSGKGLVISEYPLDTPPKASHFTFRNRLLAACSPVCFVGGGSRKSGSASTARHALELGKDILALPCDVTGDDLTNSLIQDGAGPVLSGRDIVEALEQNS